MSLQKYNIKPDGSLVPIDPARNEHLITVCRSEEVDAELTRLREENEQLRLSLQASAYLRIKAENDLLNRAVEWLAKTCVSTEMRGIRHQLGWSEGKEHYMWYQVPAEFAEIISARKSCRQG